MPASRATRRATRCRLGASTKPSGRASKCRRRKRSPNHHAPTHKISDIAAAASRPAFPAARKPLPSRIPAKTKNSKNVLKRFPIPILALHLSTGIAPASPGGTAPTRPIRSRAALEPNLASFAPAAQLHHGPFEHPRAARSGFYSLPAAESHSRIPASILPVPVSPPGAAATLNIPPQPENTAAA
jgi:hypothetical protein